MCFPASEMPGYVLSGLGDAGLRAFPASEMPDHVDCQFIPA
jgi:hypothetical protein